ncbi:hypothetical protein [Streptomyces sp. NPDC047024]|uniref:hypothetical protein n=1 Tax=Streptomyces sp. NPDC047024 TaxID=3155476 RepID=UPI0033C40C32
MGDWGRFEKRTYTVVALTRMRVRLADVHGTGTLIDQVHLQDASLLLAHALAPEPMRPGWSDALKMSRPVLPHRRPLSLDERLAHAVARSH